MKRHLYMAVCAAALLYAGAAVVPMCATAQARDSAEISFDSFHDQLAPYGDWVYSDRWGEVWIPGDVSSDFQPYGSEGHWVNTDEYGWTWASDYEWGDIPFHYGRWVNDPDDGWLWIPGYVWSPAWVVWRSNDQMMGWMPMPPDREFLSDAGVDVSSGGLHVAIDFGNTGDYYGYRDWYGPSYDESLFAASWVFVGTNHFADRDFRRYEEPRNNYAQYIRNTNNVTNYTVVNNYVVNKSVNEAKIEQASGHKIEAVHAAEAFHKPQMVTRVDQGKQAQKAAFAESPHGKGTAGSAPKPTQQVIDKLSNKAPPAHNGKAPEHLFTKQTIANAPGGGKPAQPGAPGAHPGEPAKPEAQPNAPHPGMAPNGAEPHGPPNAAEREGMKPGTPPKPEAAPHGQPEQPPKALPPSAPAEEHHAAPPEANRPEMNRPGAHPEEHPMPPEHAHPATPPEEHHAMPPQEHPAPAEHMPPHPAAPPEHAMPQEHAAPPAERMPPHPAAPPEHAMPQEHAAPPPHPAPEAHPPAPPPHAGPPPGAHPPQAPPKKEPPKKEEEKGPQ